jgi:hypothetical protein
MGEILVQPWSLVQTDALKCREEGRRRSAPVPASPGGPRKMDGQRFDEWTKAFAGLTGREGVASRRRVVRGLLGGTAALLGLGVVRPAGAQTKLPGQQCATTSECSQSGGPVVCASNGIASDGALNCCRESGGACASGAGCCGDLICADNGIASDGTYNCCRYDGGACSSGSGCCGALLCVNGVCGGSSGTLLPGQSCATTSQCSQSGGPVVCASNGISSDGALNCCRNQGGACTGGAGCCGILLCVNGVCTGPVESGLALGSSCTASGQCDQTGGAVACADNGIASDGALNCCRNEGGVCAAGAHCCGDLVCADNGIASDGALNCCRNAGGRCTSGSGCCGALLCVNGTCRTSGFTGGNLAPGQPCTSTSQCSQTGGTTVCADNGISSDGALNCCRNQGGTCVGGAGCCGALLCTNGVCGGTTSGGGNLLPGQICTATSQCSQTGGATVCADNGISSDGSLNCCRNQGGTCTSGAGCCGSLLCTNGVCGGSTSSGGTLLPGQTCTATSQCSQTGGAVVCADNGIAGDGALNCCRNEGGACSSGAGCCGALLCNSGVCLPSGSGPVG